MKLMTHTIKAFCIVIILSLFGCTSMSTSSIVVGEIRPEISPSDVKLCHRPPENYDEIAIVNANNLGGNHFGEQAKVDTVIKRLKIVAAKLGANGILLEGIGDQYAGSINNSVGSAHFTGNSAYGSSYGVSTAAMLKTGKAMAIYVK